MSYKRFFLYMSVLFLICKFHFILRFQKLKFAILSPNFVEQVKCQRENHLENLESARSRRDRFRVEMKTFEFLFSFGCNDVDPHEGLAGQVGPTPVLAGIVETNLSNVNEKKILIITYWFQKIQISTCW